MRDSMRDSMWDGEAERIMMNSGQVWDWLVMLIQNAEEISDREVDRSGLLVCGTAIIQERASLHGLLYNRALPHCHCMRVGGQMGRWTGRTVDWWDGGLVGRGICGLI